MKIEARPWKPQDLLDNLQEIIDEEPDQYLNTRRTTLCEALSYLKEYFSERYDGALTRSELASEYLSICDNDCAGDMSVGIPPCPFFDFPDVDDDRPHPDVCKLRSLLSADQERGHTSSPAGWISVEDRLPEPGQEVLLLAHG